MALPALLGIGAYLGAQWLGGYFQGKLQQQAAEQIRQQQKEALDYLERMKKELQEKYPQLAQEIERIYSLDNPQYRQLMNLIQQQGQQMLAQVQKDIAAGRIRTQEDLSRMLGGAPSGRVAEALRAYDVARGEQLQSLLTQQALREAQLPAELAARAAGAKEQALFTTQLTPYTQYVPTIAQGLYGMQTPGVSPTMMGWGALMPALQKFGEGLGYQGGVALANLFTK